MSNQNAKIDLSAVIIVSRIFSAIGIVGVIYAGLLIGTFAMDSPTSTISNFVLAFLLIFALGATPVVLLPLLYTRCVADARLPATIYFWGFSLAIIFFAPIFGWVLAAVGIKTRLAWRRQIANSATEIT